VYKLFITFEGAAKEATGVCCLERGIVATGGHCVYDEEYGRAIAIEAHISYHGAESHLRKAHEVRIAAQVAVPRGWYDSFLRQNDIALIRLRSPFDNVVPLKLKNCPVKGANMTICVAGYPMDVPGGNEGQYMWGSTGPGEWDLEQNPMLIHRLDTFRGELFLFIV
jgi:V8-like Glu-specific endopeptidase